MRSVKGIITELVRLDFSSVNRDYSSLYVIYRNEPGACTHRGNRQSLNHLQASGDFHTESRGPDVGIHQFCLKNKFLKTDFAGPAKKNTSAAYTEKMEN